MLKYWFWPLLARFLGQFTNSSQLQHFILLERTIEVLNEIICLKVTVTPRAAFVIVINLSAEMPIRDCRSFSADVFLLAVLLCCYLCLSMLLVSSSFIPSASSFPLSCETSCLLMCQILSRCWLSAAFRGWSV